MLALFLVIAAGAGAAFFLAAGVESESRSSSPVFVDVTTPGSLGETPASTVAPEPVDLVGSSLAPALDELARGVGPTYRVQRFVIYPGYLVAYVEPPDLPGELDRWTVYPGSNVSGPVPEQNPSPGFEDELFAVEEIDVAVLATLGGRAATELGIEPDLTYLIVNRSAADGNQVLVSAYVSNERRSGYVRFALDGTLISVHGG